MGIPLRDYDEMTPHELAIFIEENQKREKFMHDERVTQAYLNAVLQRAKRMPKLEKLIGKAPVKKKPMTDKQMLNVIRALNKQMGGKEVGG
ncbi:hypothetical protein [Paenibacillus methanolicus]|uniref:Uncharacterized protein n=1 Tax=Paenibacillus methanolicus TaxID=582686 RepID=A0A5S5BN39_9BACL|nr:hypothetical protein [Paenibacillus methanolicus]TYP67698.1 hypothetical protein BCM02_12323 [Paenibacillus methanolicus]